MSGLLAIAALCAAGPAAAATQVGQTGTPTDCSVGAGLLFIQDGVASGASYAAPSSGVITSWSHQAYAASGVKVQLKVLLSDGDPGEYTVQAQSALEPVTSGELNTFIDQHIPIVAGELISAYFESGGLAGCGFTTPNAGDTEWEHNGNPMPGDPFVAVGPFEQFRVNVSATLEPDADGDLYGDETQDQCPTNASTNGPCPASSSQQTTGSLSQGTSQGTSTAALKQGACANASDGTNANDTITGTSFGDLINGLGGSDILAGGAGDDCLNGGKGNDRLAGGAGKDKLSGGGSNDKLSGGTGNDKLSGGGSNDKLSGGSGNDKLSGGSGNDTLAGGAGNDSLSGGRGKNTLSGGAGNDVLNIADGKKDSANCGRGRDRVRADARDTVRGCETVRRRS